MKSPYKLTTFHNWHMKNGAQTSTIDGWVRVLKYGDSQGETDAGKLSVGICDVTPIAKIEIHGAKAAEVLQDFAGIPMPMVGDSVSFLPAGYPKQVRVVSLTSERYWVLAGVMLRDRLSTSLAEAVREKGCVHATDVTSSFAAALLVGPSARAVLKKLGSVPIDQMKPGQCIQTSTARVWSLLIRKGSAWMLFVSRDYGEYVWESVMAAGYEFGIQPIGMSAAEVITGAEENDVATL